VLPPYEKQVHLLHQTLFNEIEKEISIGITIDGKGFSQCAVENRSVKLAAFDEKLKQFSIKPIEIDTQCFSDAFVSAVDSLILKLKQEQVAL